MLSESLAMNKEQVLVVDLETNSPDARSAHILEVGLASVDLSSGQITKLIDTLVCPACDETEWRECWFMGHSRLSPEQILGAPALEPILSRVCEYVSRSPVTAYNRSFDIQVLYRHGVPVPLRAPCLMLAAKDILCLPGYYGDYKYPKFEEAWGYFFPGQPLTGNHRAGVDVIREAELLVAMYKGGAWKYSVERFERVR